MNLNDGGASGRDPITQIRISENREIGVLNDRLADYISDVRFAQAFQRKLKLHLEQLKFGKPRKREDMEISLFKRSMIAVEAKSRYDADAEKIAALIDELSSTRSRYEAAMRGRDMNAEDSLLVRLCDLRSQLCLAKGRGKVIQEECARLRREKQKFVDDIASQRQILDRETQERYSYERRAFALLQESEELLKSCKGVQVPVLRFSNEDIERERKRFRAEVEASMGDIRKQHEILASTVKSEMEQWYKGQVIGINVKQRDEASSFKNRLADLRKELVDVRTRLNHLEERNRLLTSLIGDFEDVRDQEKKLSASCVKKDEENLRKLIERYELISSAPRDKSYSVVTLRAEILRYKELLDGVGPRDNRNPSPPGVTVTSTANYTFRDERSRTGYEHRGYTMQRSAQGNATIGRVARDGSYVTIENTSMDIDQHIGEWTLRSTRSSLEQVSYTFPCGFILTPQSTVQVFARGKGPHDPPRSLVCEAESTFATGEDLAIYLYDNNGQERAHLTQREFFATGGDDSGF